VGSAIGAGAGGLSSFTTWMNRNQLYAFIAGVVIIAAWLIRLVRRTGPGGGYAAAARAIGRQALVMGHVRPHPGDHDHDHGLRAHPGRLTPGHEIQPPSLESRTASPTLELPCGVCGAAGSRLAARCRKFSRREYPCPRVFRSGRRRG